MKKTSRLTTLVKRFEMLPHVRVRFNYLADGVPLRAGTMFSTAPRWHASLDFVEIGGDGVLTHPFGDGATPAQAIEDLWRQVVTELPAEKYIYATDSARRCHFRWHSDRWCDATPKRQCQ